MPLHYYDPDNVQEYKKLKKNFKKEMKKPKPTFVNNFQEDKKEIRKQSPNPPISKPTERKYIQNNDDETVTYQIKTSNKQAKLTKLGKRRRLIRNLGIYLSILAILLWIGILENWPF